MPAVAHRPTKPKPSSVTTAGCGSRKGGYCQRFEAPHGAEAHAQGQGGDSSTVCTPQIRFASRGGAVCVPPSAASTHLVLRLLPRLAHFLGGLGQDLLDINVLVCRGAGVGSGVSVRRQGPLDQPLAPRTAARRRRLPLTSRMPWAGHPPSARAARRATGRTAACVGCVSVCWSRFRTAASSNKRPRRSNGASTSPAAVRKDDAAQRTRRSARQACNAAGERGCAGGGAGAASAAPGGGPGELGLQHQHGARRTECAKR